MPDRAKRLARAMSAPEHFLDPQSRIVIGICAMDKKAHSKPFKEILSRVTSFNEFEVVVFGDHCILEKPVEEWPCCDCLLSWHSDGFPLHKAQSYVALRKPFCVNDSKQQEVLLDRRAVYRTLQENSIPVPRHIIVSREYPGQEVPGFEEDHDSVQMNGVRISKPFVEKPVSGEDHNVFIYYPHSMGGGVKRLFRKVDNKSADYDSSHPGTVRREGSYIYEVFLTTGGTDVKVYTVGPRYAHAEARKSPVVDGKVQRAPDGKEVRFPVLLSPQEKEISRMVTLAFGQKVCGFDLLRSERGKSYVCDVNGWSFVKNSKKYYDDAAGILRSIILNALAPHRLGTMPVLLAPPITPVQEEPEEEGMGTMKESQSLQDVKGAEGAVEGEQENEDEELRCVIAIARHGDRTPKQKLKINITQPCLLELFHKYQEKGKQAKLKSPAQLQELLDVVRGLSSRLDQVSQAMERQAHKKEEEQAQQEQQQKRQEQQPKPQLQHQQGGHKHGHKKDAQGQPKKQQQQQQPGKAEQKEQAAPAVQHALHAEPAGAPKQKSPDAPASVTALPPITTSAAGVQHAGMPVTEGEASLFADPTLGWIEGRDALDEMREKLRIVRTVLEQGGHFSGVNRKVQIKPVRWGSAAEQLPCPGASTDAAAAGSQTAGAAAATAASKNGDAHNPSTKGDGKPAQPVLLEGLLVVKWGGVLTHAGRQQAEQLGMHFRACMYPKHGPAGGGLLRLHSTYRHDLKIYSSDEGRVQTSAAAFTKGLLDLEGNSLTPILVSLVNKDASMLEAFGKGASEEMQRCKRVIDAQLVEDPSLASGGTISTCPSSPMPCSSASQNYSRLISSPHGGSQEDLKSDNLLDWNNSNVPTRTPTPSISSGGQGAPPGLSAQHNEAAQEAAAAATVAAVTASAQPASPCQSQAPPSQTGSQEDTAPLHPAEYPKLMHMPDHPKQLLRRLVELMGLLVEELRQLCLNENVEKGALQAKPYSSISQSPEEWRLEPGKPCSGERTLLLYDRWRKLYKQFYKKPKKQKEGQEAVQQEGTYDISKIPDIYDSVKHDTLHNSHLNLSQLKDLYGTAKQLSDTIIPHEYGLDPEGKLSIGSKIAKELVGKLLADLCAMREESLVTAGTWEGGNRGSDAGSEEDDYEYQDLYRGTDSLITEFGRTCLEDEQLRNRRGTLSAITTPEQELPPSSRRTASDAPKVLASVSKSRTSLAEDSKSSEAGSTKQEGDMGSHKGSSSSFLQRLGGAAGEEEGGAAAPSTLGSSPPTVEAEGETEEREPETLHRLCPTFASDINSPLRHVRTRIYFTSESHIHSLVNVLRFCHLQAEHPTPPLVSESSQQALDTTPEMDYLTHIVFRMYENKSFPVSAPQRFRVEVSLSPGAAYNPITHPPAANHTLPTVPRMQLNSGTAETLSELEELLSPLGVRRKVSPSIYALRVALRAPTTPGRDSLTQVSQPTH